MREIKFRAWDKQRKEMLQHTLFETWWYTFPEQDETGNARAAIPVKSQQEMKYRLTPMQYTGLKDKNGKEIYEGDIVKISTLYNKAKIIHIGEIKFESATFIFACDEVTDNYMTFIELFGDWEQEVIGNIYESCSHVSSTLDFNPEPLKNKIYHLNGDDVVAKYKDIKSAVEWLKLKNSERKKKSFSELMLENPKGYFIITEDELNEAFEDVIQNDKNS